MAKKKSAWKLWLLGIGAVALGVGGTIGAIKLADHIEANKPAEEQPEDETQTPDTDGTENDAGTEASVANAMFDEYMQNA